MIDNLQLAETCIGPLLLPNICADSGFIRSDRCDEIAPQPEMYGVVVLQPAHSVAGDWNAALALTSSTACATGYFGWTQDPHSRWIGL